MEESTLMGEGAAAVAMTSADPAPQGTSTGLGEEPGHEQGQGQGQGQGPGSRPVVLYVAGSGRSGSTLLERTLEAIPGFTTVGELLDLFRRDALGERCGCGRPLLECPFWTEVGRSALSSFEPGVLARVQSLQRQVARQRHFPRLLSPLGSRAFDVAVQRYGAAYAEVYRAVAQEAGARVVVDSSKWPTQALALRLGGVDVRVLHLVRDVRGVAYSLAKQVQRAAAIGDPEQMWAEPAVVSAARWLFTQSEVDLVRARGVPVTRVRYGDFVADPGREVARALRELGIDLPAGGLSHVDGRSVTLGPSHGLSGNPSRFRHGATQLRPDNEWQTRMPRRDRVAATAIALPQVLRLSAAGPPAAGTAVDVASAGTAGAPRPTRPARTEPAAGPGRALPDGRTWPLVSAVVATHGRPKLVREALASAVAQTYPGEIEIVLVHDREPEDPSLAELGRPGREITVTSNTHSDGLAGARNTGLDLARGQFVATLDDDDTWHPPKVQRQIERLLDEPDLLMVGAGIRLRLPAGKVAEWPGRAERIPYDLLLRNRVKELHSSTLLMRRDVFAKAGRYDEGLPRGYAEDWDFILRVARVGRVGVVREPLADIRKDVPSYYRGRAESTAVALEHFLGKHPDIARSRRGNARITGQLAFARSCVGDRRAALRYAVTSLRSWPLSPHPYVALAHLATGVDPSRVQQAARLLGRGMA